MKREPVVIAGAGTALLEALIVLAVQMGWVSWNSDQIASLNNFIITFVALAALVVPLYFARARVTPIADPKTADGEAAELVKRG